MKLDDLQLQFSPPTFNAKEVGRVLEQRYGIRGNLIRLEGERDQNFHVETNSSQSFVFKISGQSEAESYVDLQAKVLAHVESVAPDIEIPRGVPDIDSAIVGHHTFDNGQSHSIRLVTYVKGTPLESVSSRTAYEIGVLQGNLCRALSSFFHPAARNPMPWDVSNGIVLDDTLLEKIDPEILVKVDPHLNRLREISLPALRHQRAQIIHNDMHTGNVLGSDADKVSGVIDFGDVLFAPLVQDLAVSATGMADACPTGPLDLIRELERGFCHTFPLSIEERELLMDATLLRSLLCVELGRYKLGLGSRSTEQADVYAGSVHGLLGLLEAFPKPRVSDKSGSVATRRTKALSPSYSLFYDEPVHIVRGRGTSLFDSTGREYLDCYNNVPSVGHCNPHVVAALQKQAETLNTHWVHPNKGT